jgi:hypothetical protein
MSQLRTFFVSTEKQQIERVAFEDLELQMKGVFSHYRRSEDIIEKIIDFLRQTPDQTEAKYERLNIMIEFVQCYPLLIKRNKNASPGMDLVFTNQATLLSKGRAAPGLHSVAEEEEYADKLVEFVWTKIHERHKNTTHAFRFFDQKGKGKIKKADLIEGFDKLRIKLSNEDFDKFWSFIDSSKRGKVTFNEFCALGEQKVLKLVD